jgi:hypothetical protein
METTVNILYLGKHPEILDTVVRLINQNESWNGIGISDFDLARAVFTTLDFHVVLFGCGIEEKDETELRQFFAMNNPNTKLVQHYGGGSGLLSNEIYAALSGNTTAMPSFLS